MTIKENIKVKVKYRSELGSGEVIRVCEDHGEYMVDIVFEKDGKRILETFPEKVVEPVDDILQKFEKGLSDRPVDFFLKQLAYQLPLENSGGELSNSKADLLPHQILLTHKVVEERRRRFLIADEVGLGKTIETGMIIKELLSRKDADRILIICPAGLTVNWRNELKDCFRLYFDIFGNDFTDKNLYAWEKHNHVIVSIDTIKKPSRLERLMKAPGWDIIIFDEAHHLSRKRYGEKIEVTQNYRLAEKMKGITRDMLFLSATPHQGDSYQFWSLIQLLDDQLFESPEAMIDHRGLLGRVMIRRIKKEATDIEGNAIFMRRKVHSQKFGLSIKEQRFYEKLTEYLKEGYNAAGLGNDKTTKQQRAVGFVMATFQKIMSSSPRAIKQALRRRLLAIYARRQMALENGIYGSITREESSKQIIRYQEEMRKIIIELLAYEKEIIDYTDADTYISKLKQRIKKRPKFDEEITKWALDAQEMSDDIIEVPANIPHEDQKVKELIGLIDDGPDRKFNTLVRAIEQIRSENKKEKIIIFTQYLETLYFLKKELGKYYDSNRIAVIKGGPLDDKIASCESFWEENRAQFLISTSAGGEGINLQICRILFNYDLPWNPMAVEQRIGRIHRYGQTDTAQVYNLIAEGTIEEKVYSILEQKLFEIAKTIGKVDNVTGEIAEDFRSEILGFLSSSINYNDLYKEALINKNYRRTEEEISEALKQARESSNALRQLTQDLKTFNLESYIELKGNYTLEDLKTFCEKAIISLGGSFIPSGNIDSITVPPVLKKYAGVSSQYENVTFSRKVATKKKGIDLMGIGHPLIDSLIDYYKSDAISGDVLISQNDGVPEIFSARYISIIDFEDSTKKELYKELILLGTHVKSDIELLTQRRWKDNNYTISNSNEINKQLSMLIRNYEAKLRSEYKGVLSIRSKCVGIMQVNNNF
ncbi:MAG: helicase [Candidatus Jettenia sp.]|uniref:Helicase n=1 Tax=Candidatus Jettenia caeni TaxID=247490 RepID=I3IJB9_9BACT|nr:SNF2-related protein [Candidatus Jettenia sp. AMX1]MBC6928868.1 helicase [Candidatus Jettenia sp.]GAB61814.1 helicase [Candidatus Jettenia caeni]KAA0250886.1 MAG: DEAD/DEAH box helicase [Candidatus Jettenia sp. AMX1]MCE7879870.1 helicase [Candidatus Jettenia sp. AMX1]MCQ3926649.1 helicase [Candidatus Jettenia sp.]